MIARLAGILVSKQPPHMIIDVAGVGYEVEAPLPVFFDLPATGQPVVILTHLSVKEDSHTLYGFATEAERRLFRQLLRISGIGAKLALTILSGARGEELARYVAEGDAASLTRLPGIGKKTAERIIIELRDKLGDLSMVSAAGSTGTRTATSDALGEAITALIALGYKAQEAARMARSAAQPGMGVEEIIRHALQAMVKHG
jgi:Holliday junction DNA helicase RuvA